MRIYMALALLGILLIGCSSPRFNINEVDFSYEHKQQEILPLRYHDRSSLTSETADKIINSVLTSDSNAWGYYYITHRLDRSERKLFDWDVLNFISDIVHIFGVPKSKVYYDLRANAYLFDSHGDIVEIYEETGSFSKYKGLYYGHNIPVKQVSDEYKKMFYSIINNISSNKKHTNDLLKLSGTMSEEKSAEVYTKIYMIIK